MEQAKDDGAGNGFGSHEKHEIMALGSIFKLNKCKQITEVLIDVWHESKVDDLEKKSGLNKNRGLKLFKLCFNYSLFKLKIKFM